MREMGKREREHGSRLGREGERLGRRELIGRVKERGEVDWKERASWT